MQEKKTALIAGASEGIGKGIGVFIKTPRDGLVNRIKLQ